MNREETAKAIEVMQAFVDGAEIEVDHPEMGWIVLHDEPSWDWLEVNYRIKPKPREFWLAGDDNCRDGSWRVVPGSGMGAIKVREILD